MTNKDAVEIEKYLLDEHPEPKYELCRRIMEAIEKQIPKKVNISLKGTTDWNTKCYCPNCRTFISNGKYCSNCGQALDWGDTE